MSVRQRKRTVCDACGQRCYVSRSEVLFHVGGRGGAYWRWATRSLCPPCSIAVRSFWFPRNDAARVDPREGVGTS